MKKLLHSLFLAACLIGFIGCTEPSATDDANPNPTEPADHDHDHDHADHAAPHGGHLIELGRGHQYHAELVDDQQTETVTVYMMDGDMQPLAIDEQTISLLMTAADDTQTFQLAIAESGTKYTLQDAQLLALLAAEDAQGKLRVKIDGKPYTGSFKHDHDHEHQ